MKQFNTGFEWISGIIKAFMAVLSIYNFLLRIIDLPVADWFAPFLGFWRQYIIGFIEIVNIKLPWLIPDWN